MRGHEDIITAIVFSNDDLFALSGSADKTVRMWHLGSGSCTRVLKGHSEPVTSVAISQYGRLAVSGSRDNSVRLWDLSIGECIRIYEGHLKPVVLVKFSADGREIMSLASDGIRIWDSESSACIRVIESRELISMRENSICLMGGALEPFSIIPSALDQLQSLGMENGFLQVLLTIYIFGICPKELLVLTCHAGPCRVGS